MIKEKKLIDYLAEAQKAQECQTFKEAAEIIATACKKTISADFCYVMLVNEDLSKNEIIFQDSDQAEYQIEEDGSISAPVEYKNEIIGRLGMGIKTGEISQYDSNIVSLFAKNIAIAFCNMRDRDRLKNSEKKYRTLFNNMPVGIYVTNSEEQIVEINNRMLELLNITSLEDFDGKDIIRHYVDPQDRVEWQEQLDKTGRVQYLETRFKGINGEIIWISESANLIEGENGQQYCEVSMEDITTRKNSEQAFTKTFLQLDSAHRDLNEKARWMENLNSFLIDLADLSNEKLLYNHLLEKVHLWFQSDYESIGRLSEDNSYITITALKDGVYNDEKIPLDKDDLSLLNSYSHNIIQLSKDDSKLKNKKTGLTDFFNSVFSNGENGLILVPLNYENKVYGNIMLSLKDKTLDDNQRYFIENLAEYISILAANLSLYKQVDDAYQQLKKAQDTIKQQERIKAMGQIASGITHDINNTLSPITLYADALIQTEKDLSERGRKYVKTILTAVADIENVTQRLRTFYKHDDDIVYERIIVSELFDEVVDLTRPKWKNIPNKKGISININKSVESEDSEIYGVRSDLRESLLNCIFNAVDAMPEGGNIELAEYSFEGKVILSINDDGSGMDEEQINHCLEPFFTTKGSAGTGLGLAEVYGMIQRHEGELRIESKLGEGTRIIMMLNGAEKNIKESSNHYEEKDSLIPPALNILCVDDDVRVLEGLNEMFALDGHEVSTAGNGIEALGKLEELKIAKNLPDVVITDLGMPEMDGYELAKNIKINYSEIPVIMLSGWGNQIKEGDYNSEDIYVVLSKPPRIKKLREVLYELSEGRKRK